MIDLKPASRQMAGLLAGVSGDQLADSTPCTEYHVGDLIDHVDHLSRIFGALARGDTDGVAAAATTGPGAAHLDPDWRHHVTAHVEDLGTAWDDPAAWVGVGQVPGSDLSNEVWGKITLTELVVHGWDLATATSQPFDLPQATLQACLDHVAAFIPAAPIPALWGPAHEVASGATLLDKIVAITGRTP
ncbi:MAG TPA: TIGR03086 family metal-binding protein [Acidimicrobiales bacterium]|jgi:uncharacterized protein (TIGR03086 family)|nr:TIGR03086 family metal-binding protein [Acidimicrobiales bacterium]